MDFSVFFPTRNFLDDVGGQLTHRHQLPYSSLSPCPNRTLSAPIEVLYGIRHAIRLKAKARNARKLKGYFKTVIAALVAAIGVAHGAEVILAAVCVWERRIMRYGFKSAKFMELDGTCTVQKVLNKIFN